MYKLHHFHYDLPKELIATYPAKNRSSSRLMVVQKDLITHHIFKDITQFIRPNDLLIFNNTKVLPARLFGKKITGGKVEMLVERILNDQKMIVQMRASKALKSNDLILIDPEIVFRVINKNERFYEVELQVQQSLYHILEKIGEIPLPHYFNRTPEESDKERYQTIYAREKGSVAAPTAGFHFDEILMSELLQKKVEMAFLTLHIGAGTFAPVRTENITDHKMHTECFHITDEVCEKIVAAKQQNGRVIAVGTTTLRALESVAKAGTIKPATGETDIFIYPGFKFQCVDALITNFHLPSSTLLMLVSAFAGYETMMTAYKTAVKEKYRFFSYGDAMFIEREVSSC